MSLVSQAYRGSGTEDWIKRIRDRHEKGSQAWLALDDLLDDYRLHADCGVDLKWDVPEGEGWTQ